MIEGIISDGNNASIEPFSPYELDCRRNYAVVCQLDKKDYPWDYAGKTIRVELIGLSGTASITDTSSSSYISIPLFGSFS
ncbi:hypothetical protein AMJ47_03165 [Parcubacteria bacterium DG_72]|nr:MAG: hypothetical protein AMJ47_03165 [Parcubacteria bacterium DG_72]